MRCALHRRLRSTGLTVVGALVLVGSLLGGNAGATTSVRQYVPTLSPVCAATGSTSQFTATITNGSGSNQNLGSAILTNDPRNGFTHVGSFTSLSAANGGKSWMVLRDPLFGAGLLLRATSLSNALAPGESVSVTFSAQAPSADGVRTWRTWAFQGTLFFLSPFFSLAPGASQPTVNVVSSPPCGGSVSIPCPSSTGCTAADVPVGPTGSTVTVVVPPCPPGHVCDGNLTVFDNRDPNFPVTSGCPTEEAPFVSSVTILPPPGHTATDPPITLTFTDEVSVSGAVCKVDATFPDGRFLDFCGGETSIPPCILSEVFPEEGPSTIVVEMTSTDPIAKH